MKRLIPFDTHMNYGPMRMAIYSSGIDVTVESDILDNMWGCYSEANRVILIDRRLTYTAKKCVLIHELVPHCPPFRFGGNKPLCLTGVGLSGFSYSHGFPRILTFSRDNVGKMWAKTKSRA